MKKINLKYLTLSALMTMFLHFVSFGQQQFKLDQSVSKLVVSGTSTVHDWEMEAEDFNCNATISLNGNSISGINSIDFTCPVESIKSHNKIMDNKTYKALNSEKYPKISFIVNSSVKVNLSENKSSVNGILTINNTTQEVTLAFTSEKINQNQIKVNGEVPLKMSDFNIKPPTAMMGTLKTGDEIKVSFEILLDSVSEMNEREAD